MDGPRAQHDDVALAGGSFLMGDPFGEGYPTDGETPVHEVSVHPFRIDRTAVTNELFARFVHDTGYRTEAEVFGFSAVFHLLSTADETDVIGRPPTAPWWLGVRGADWRHPFGRDSALTGLEQHPVVHVSYNDAIAYCEWSGRRLPSEAEWEFAARGGASGARYPWGNTLLAEAGSHMTNIWQGVFPAINSAEDGFVGTAPVGSFPPNGYGLYEMAGNVWEWCADWFSPHYYLNSARDDPRGPESGTHRVTRGGSYLCHDSYCNRYRVAARTGNTPDSSTGNCGFRTVVA